MGDPAERRPGAELGAGHPRGPGRALILVVDASAAIWAATSEQGLDVLGTELIAPPLLWSEVHAGLHVRLWKGTMRRSDVEASRRRFGAMPIERRHHEELHAVAWAIAEELGVARTYDCEYLALARLLDTKVVTLDGRLRRGADRLGLVTDPTEL